MDNDYSKLTQSQLNSRFFNACKKGDMEVVKYLVASPELTIHANVGSHHAKGLQNACKFNKEAVVDDLVNHDEVKKNAGYNKMLQNYGVAFNIACWKGNLSIVANLHQMVLASDSHAIFQGLLNASSGQNIHVLDYIMSQEKFQNLPNKESLKSKLFHCACASAEMAVINFLLKNLHSPYDLDKDDLQGLKSACKTQRLDVVMVLTSP